MHISISNKTVERPNFSHFEQTLVDHNGLTQQLSLSRSLSLSLSLSLSPGQKYKYVRTAKHARADVAAEIEICRLGFTTAQI